MAAGLLRNLARVVGVGAACATIALYVWALGILAVTSLFLFAILLALGAAWASVMIRPFELIAVSIASFIPPAISFAFTAVYVGLFYMSYRNGALIFLLELAPSQRRSFL